jgi:tetrapyrrole methylase family protein/MazG family protein
VIRVERLPRPPFSAGELARLRNLDAPLWHPDPDQESFQALTMAGLDVRPIGAQIESGTLLVPAATGAQERLVGIVDRLLGPGGCPWDRAQTHATLKRYLLEESYELFEAIDSEDLDAMVEELGDVLLQPILHAGMLRRDQKSDVDEVAGQIADKLVRRHPHVFGDVQVEGVENVLSNWDAIKKSEKQLPKGVLEGVPKSLPALLRAHEVSKRAARQGFEWPSLEGVWEKFDEEVAELREAIRAQDQAQVKAELGDLLFTIVNLARWLKIEPEEALAQMVSRFQTRFEFMEANASEPLSQLSPEAWDALWNQAKAATEAR